MAIKPNVVVSFGGFASIPVVVDAKILGIPIIIHEQTSAIGRANGFSSQIADKIALARNESLKYFPRGKSVVIGNPVMKEITKIKPKLKLGNPPTIFVTGGSRGSQTINENVEKILRTLLSKYKVIHQTGGLDYLKFSKIKEQLPMALKNNYEVFTRVSPTEVSEIFKKSDIVVARAGANTVSDLMIAKRPAILIPLSISFMDEQTKNAEIAKTFGVAKIINQKELTPDLLLKNIDESVRDYSKIVEKIKSKESPDIGAASRLLRLVTEYCK
jgi:UDP-N-acetylglucosamine--N-acetylmuramyl-(pentapeptide) pyrophosphoryl-undecaprenol N-acetylglucosamine transferase